VTDPDGIMTTKKDDINIESILSVDMFAFPRVIQRNGTIKFVSQSPEARVFEWNFGDGKTTGGTFDKIDHMYDTSGTFDVTLKVSDSENNTNSFTRKVYVSDSDSPFALLDITYNSQEPVYDEKACNGEGAYIVDRANTFLFNSAESINIDGLSTGLDYSWKI
jgi:PKD repeat protein